MRLVLQKPAAHISDRLVAQTEGGGEKIIPTSSPAPADKSAPASEPAVEVKKEEIKKEEVEA